MIDPAMVRPGRLDKLLYVDLPSPEERSEIVRTMTRKLPLGTVTGGMSASGQVAEAIEVLVRDRCDGYSGADLASLVREAGVVALKRTLGSFRQTRVPGEEWGGAEESAAPAIVVDAVDFGVALEKIGPSVSVAQRKKYHSLRNKFSGLPVRVGKDEEEKRVDGGDGKMAV